MLPVETVREPDSLVRERHAAGHTHGPRVDLMCVCVCVYIYIHIYMYIRVCVCVYIYIYNKYIYGNQISLGNS